MADFKGLVMHQAQAQAISQDSAKMRRIRPASYVPCDKELILRDFTSRHTAAVAKELAH